MSEEPKWHRDFPVDDSADNFVARRDFSRFLVLTSFAFVVGQLWIGAQNVWRRRRGDDPVVPIDGAADLPVGGALSFRYPTEDDPCLLVRTGERSYLAYSAECTHLACGIKPEVENKRLRCPCHHGYFELATGAPIAGPPRRPLPRIVLAEQLGRLCAVGIERRHA